jgi:murein DD-endopeptidase MepM/ murein hydrolase activator NlpD
MAPTTTLTGNLTDLTGVVRTLRANSATPYNVPWSNVTRYEPSFTNAGLEFGVDPALMAAMAIVESDANQTWPGTGNVITRDDGFGDGLSVGILQVKPRIWQPLVPDADAFTADGNIRLATAIMAQAITQHGSWEDALRKVYFPDDDPNRTTQNAYIRTVRSLLAEIANNTRPVPPAPQPGTATRAVDPIRVIVGGDYPPITYGWLADEGLDYYSYGVGHGTQRSTQHPGVDVPVPDETPLFTPAAGVVRCVGEAGEVTWGQGCGFFRDVDGGGIGNITILLDSGHKMTLGHCSSATVQPGQRVAAGQMVGRSGSMNGPHVHVEVSVNRDGTYWLVDPVPALQEAMGTRVTATETVFAERLPVPQPGEWDVFVTVRATQTGIPVLQFASANAPHVRKPLSAGEDFEGVMIVLGNDRNWYWVSRNGGRVPVEGTAAVGGPCVPTP